MAKVYPREQWKIQYITGETENIRDFLRGIKGGLRVDNWNIDRQTKGRKEARKEHWRKLVRDYDPPLESIISMKKWLDEASIFLPAFMKSRMIWKKDLIIQKGRYPTIDEVIKFARLVENYTGFKPWKDFTSDTQDSDENRNPLRDRLADIRRKHRDKWNRGNRKSSK